MAGAVPVASVPSLLRAVRRKIGREGERWFSATSVPKQVFEVTRLYKTCKNATHGKDNCEILAVLS